MDAQISHLLPSPISIKLWGTDDYRKFERISDVLDWCQVEIESWATEVKPNQGQLLNLWNDQRSQPNNVRQAAIQFANHLNRPEEERTDQAQFNQAVQSLDANLRKRLQFFVEGRAISSSHPAFGHIQAVSEHDADAAAALLIASLQNGQQTLSNIQPWDAVARIGFAGAYLDTSRRKTIKTLKAELATLRKRAEEDVAELRQTLDAQLQQTKDNLQDHNNSVEDRSKTWSELLANCDQEWASLKRVYDDKLALLAPTEYWRNRSTVHNKLGRNYAIAFGVALAVLVALFIIFGIDHLGSPGTESVVLAVLPVVVPAFAGIWVLRILGRLLSENLKIAQDAQERETMVKTFLALMRDESAGKSVIQNDDRRLILEALFRQSTVTATDDAPPMHWLALLRNNQK